MANATRLLTEHWEHGYDDAFVCVGVGKIVVEQWPEDTAVVRGSVGFRRDPRLSWVDEESRLLIANSQEHQRLVRLHLQQGDKHCLECGNWRACDQFSPDSRARDGKQGMCKLCRARRERQKYREQQGGVVRSYRRVGTSIS